MHGETLKYQMNFKKVWFEGVDWDLRDSGDGEVSGFFEQGNETSCPIKCGEFFQSLRDYQLIMKNCASYR